MNKLEAAKKKAQWLAGCLAFGWKKSDLDDLGEIWDQFRDEYGNYREQQSTDPETLANTADAPIEGNLEELIVALKGLQTLYADDIVKYKEFSDNAYSAMNVKAADMWNHKRDGLVMAERDMRILISKYASGASSSQHSGDADEKTKEIDQLMKDWRNGLYPDFSDWEPKEKTDFINGMVPLLAKEAMMCFYSLGLKTHIECDVENPGTNEKFIFRFIKVDTFTQSTPTPPGIVEQLQDLNPWKNLYSNGDNYDGFQKAVSVLATLLSVGEKGEEGK